MEPTELDVDSGTLLVVAILARAALDARIGRYRSEAARFLCGHGEQLAGTLGIDRAEWRDCVEDLLIKPIRWGKGRKRG